MRNILYFCNPNDALFIVFIITIHKSVGIIEQMEILNVRSFVRSFVRAFVRSFSLNVPTELIFESCASERFRSCGVLSKECSSFYIDDDANDALQGR
jgi:hypothetical protein